ncbi:MAG: hypothetical protein RLY21_2373 [Planctomycetota bacterium]
MPAEHDAHLHMRACYAPRRMSPPVHVFPMRLRTRLNHAWNGLFLFLLPIVALGLIVLIALDSDPWSTVHLVMLAPTAIIVVSMVGEVRSGRPLAGALRAWYPLAVMEIRKSISSPILVVEGAGSEGAGTKPPGTAGSGVECSTLAFGTRLGERIQIHYRIPAATLAAVSWEPDSGSSRSAPTSEWLLLMQRTNDRSEEILKHVAAAREATTTVGVRAYASAILKDRADADREGLRLVEFLRSAGIALEPDATPSTVEPGTFRRGAPPSAPDGIDEVARTPGQLAAAAQRVRWVVVSAG